MKKKILIPALLTITSLGILVGCDNNKTSQVEAAPKKAVDASMVVQGYEWGPAVPKVIVEFEDVVSGFDKTTFKVNTAGTNRTITDAYNSDKDGNKVTTPSKYVAFEMTVKYGMWAAEANPFTYDQTTGRNSWAQTYELKLTLASNKTFKVGDYQYGNENKWSVFKTNLAGKYTVPETAVWEKDTFKLVNGQYTLQRASYTPTEAKTDSSKNPLVIWLHGAGEGGTDIDIDLLGNEVTALAKEQIQSYFTNDTQKGAYVLAVQTPTMWMDKGDGTYNHQGEQGGKQISCYTDTLWGAITDYVSKNDDVDTSRIYIGGCSNGGYMTMNMMFEHGDYFAAFYPICEAYMNANITDEMINQVKDYNIWFLHSQDDTTVDPRGTSIPTYYRLLKAGAKNVHYTLTQNVKGTDDPNATYMGHYSWIYAFNDQVKKEFDTDAVKNDIDNVTITNGKIDAKDKIYVDYTNCTKDSNMFTWMAAQNKAAVAPVSNGIKFEAEDGALTVAEGSGQWDTIKVEENAGKASGDKAVGFFTKTGSKITWTFTSDKAVTGAKLNLSLANSYAEADDPTNWASSKHLQDFTLSESYSLKVNDGAIDLSNITISADDKVGTKVTKTATWGDQTYSYEEQQLDYAQFKSYSVTVDIKEGENVIVFEKGDTAKGVNVDYIEFETDATLTLVK